MSGRRHLQNLKIKLMMKDKHCYYCGCEVYLYNNIESHLRPDNEATLEHLFMSFDPERKDKNLTNDEKYVLACYGCNQDIGKLRNIEHNGKEYQWYNPDRAIILEMKKNYLCSKYIL